MAPPLPRGTCGGRALGAAAWTSLLLLFVFLACAAAPGGAIFLGPTPPLTPPVALPGSVPRLTETNSFSGLTPVAVGRAAAGRGGGSSDGGDDGGDASRGAQPAFGGRGSSASPSAGGLAAGRKHGHGGGGGGGDDCGSCAKVDNGKTDLSVVGLSVFDEYVNGKRNTTASVPCPSIATGAGLVLTAINSVIRLSDASTGATLQSALLSNFFGLVALGADPERTFVSRPSVSYDRATKRFYVVAALFVEDVGVTSVLVGATKTSDPRDGAYVYQIDLLTLTGRTCAGFDNDTACDAASLLLSAVSPGGFLAITTTDFTFNFTGQEKINGVNLLLLPTASLKAGVAVLQLAFYPFLGVDPTTEEAATGPWASLSFEQSLGTAYYIQPSKLPLDDKRSPSAVAALPFYLVSAKAFLLQGGVLQRLYVWKLTGAAAAFATFNTVDTSKLGLSVLVVDAKEPFLVGGAAEQRTAGVNVPAVLPLLNCIRVNCSIIYSFTPPNPDRQIARVDTGIFDGLAGVAAFLSKSGKLKLFVIADSSLSEPFVGKRNGIKWLVLNLGTSGASASVEDEGLIGVRGSKRGGGANSLVYSGVSLTADGERGAIVATLVGADYFPSAAYVAIKDGRPKDTRVLVAAAGKLPIETADSYNPEFSINDNLGIAFYGEYSTVVTAADGNLWAITEYVRQSCDFASWVTSFGRCFDANGVPRRSRNTNWATRVFKLGKRCLSG